LFAIAANRRIERRSQAVMPGKVSLHRESHMVRIRAFEVKLFPGSSQN